MSTVKVLNQNKLSVIDRQEIDFENGKITYHLYRIDFIGVTRYAISVEYMNESEVCLSGSELMVAREIYGAVCRNTVTPCTLPYVVEDFFEDLQ